MITIHEGNNELNITLTPIPPALATLTGQVVDVVTGLPLAGVKVVLGGSIHYTDSNGFYNYTNLTPGDYSISFEKAGYQTLVL